MFWTLPYWVHLAAISAAFVVAERVAPWRREQALLRPGLATDVAHLVWNGVVLALVLAPAAALVTPHVDALIVPRLGRGHAAGWPLWAQGAVAFVALDLLKWGVHVTLHHVSFLWKFHRVHHSILAMDWIGNMRFHWLEIVLYDGVLYLPLLLLGFDWRVLLVLALVSTAIGHFNHANLRLPLGPLRFLLNSPGMHIWHHEHAMRYRAGCNFGINLACWDWIFGTAYMPDPAGRAQPERLGFAGVELFPRGFVAQQTYPLSQLVAARTARGRAAP